MNAAVLARWRALASSALAERLLAAALAGLSGAVLGVARWLEPSPQGHSTHLQLGLRPCTVLSWTGWPCPMCGATTTFALSADGRLAEALRNQPFALLLFSLTVGTFALSVAEAVVPRRRISRLVAWVEPWEVAGAIGFLFAMGLGWAWKAWQLHG